MGRRLALGKLRGLQATAAPSGIFTVLALDHGASLAATMRPDAPQTISYERMAAFKGAVLEALAPHASAVLLDPVYGLPPAILSRRLAGGTGLLLSLEDGDYAAPAQAGTFLAEWSVEKIKRAGAQAVKFFFYYHPHRGDETAQQEALLAEVAQECRRYDLPLFAEPLSYETPPEARRQVVVETARRLGGLGVDVLKLEFPVDAGHETDEGAWSEACRALSQVCAVPWVLLSAGVDFATFRRQVRIACRSGASGFVAGRAIWKEAAALRGEALQAHLQATTVARLQELSAIAEAAARPWTDFYAERQVESADWYRQYEHF
jgi:tagatose 1,6-diphosphate aldolase